MSGHSKWSTIKHKKGITDQKRSQVFSKLAKLIAVAARGGADPASNPQLQSAIDQARKVNMPKDNIERAIKKASGKDSAALSEITIQAITPSGVAIIITSITDNTNRTISEVKSIITKSGGKMADAGSLSYMFEKKVGPEGIEWEAKFPMAVDDPGAREKLEKFLEELDDHDDVENIYTNLQN